MSKYIGDIKVVFVGRGLWVDPTVLVYLKGDFGFKGICNRLYFKRGVFKQSV